MVWLGLAPDLTSLPARPPVGDAADPFVRHNSDRLGARNLATGAFRSKPRNCLAQLDQPRPFFPVRTQDSFLRESRDISMTKRSSPAWSECVMRELPGNAARRPPDFAALHPGYNCDQATRVVRRPSPPAAAVRRCAQAKCRVCAIHF